MNQRGRPFFFTPPSFGWGRSWLLGAAALAALGSFAATAFAASNAGLTFVLGSGSYLRLGVEEVPLPTGVRLEVLVGGKKVRGRYPLQVSPGGLTIPEFALAGGQQVVRARLAGTGAGWLTPASEGLSAEVALTVQVEVGDAALASGGEYPLLLTTETIGGETIDYATRAARLVAAGVVDEASPVAPGEPFTLVLAGTVEGLPADLR